MGSGGRTSPGRADRLMVVHMSGPDSTCEKDEGRDTAGQLISPIAAPRGGEEYTPEAMTRGWQKQTEDTRFRNGLVWDTSRGSDSKKERKKENDNL